MLLRKRWQHDWKGSQRSAIGGSKIGGLLGSQLEVKTSVLRSHQAGQEGRNEQVLMTTHSEYMVLVQTSRYLIAPDTSPSKLINISSFSHQNIAVLESRMPCLLRWNNDALHLTQVNPTNLDIGHSEIRIGFSPNIVVVLA